MNIKTVNERSQVRQQGKNGKKVIRKKRRGSENIMEREKNMQVNKNGIDHTVKKIVYEQFQMIIKGIEIKTFKLFKTELKDYEKFNKKKNWNMSGNF